MAGHLRMVMLGAPGAGKGTQAAFLAERYRVPAISTGDIFRANVSQGTPLGAEAKRYMDAGEYVPDTVTNLMVRDRIDQPDAKDGFLLDGYPRTLAQVEELDGMIAQLDGMLERSGFYHPPDRTPATRRTLRTLLTKPGWSAQEVRTLRGVLSALDGAKRAR